jgi:hypothetical protein
MEPSAAVAVVDSFPVAEVDTRLAAAMDTTSVGVS